MSPSRRLAFISFVTALLVGLASCGETTADGGVPTDSVPVAVEDSAPQVVTLSEMPATTLPPPVSTGTVIGSRNEPPVSMVVAGVLAGPEPMAVNGISVPVPHLPPQATATGVLVEAGSSGDRGPIYLVTAEESKLIADGFGFAVDPSGTRVAWSRELESGLDRSYTIVLTDLESGEVVAEGPAIDGYAEPNAWVGDRVLVNTGDGASSGTVLWDPGSNLLASAATTDQYPDVQGVRATHPASGLALVVLGDGDCWAMVDYSAAPTKLFETPDCALSLWASDLSPSGTHLAIAEAAPGPQASAPPAAWDVTLSVLDSRTGQPLASVPFVAPVQAWWESDTALLVLSNPAAGRYQVDRCTRELVCEVIWAQNGIGGGGVWLVEQQ